MIPNYALPPTAPPHNPVGKTVALYSGGLDSYLLAWLRRPDLLLMVNTGTRYGDAERRHVALHGTPRDIPLHHATLRDLALLERADKIVPGRNAHLAILAANYGDVIWLAATAGDRVLDKDEQFAAHTTTLLRHLYAPQWWLPGGRRITVQLPVKEFTKRQLVGLYLRRGGAADALATDTFSCYEPRWRGRPCGACKPCVRKWIALAVHNIDPRFDARPAVAGWRQQVEDGTWDRGSQEAADVLDAWEATA